MRKKTIFTLIILFTVYFLFHSFSYSKSISDELQENIFRLHVIANSNSENDQNLKLYVRDNIVHYLEQYHFKNKGDLISFLYNNKSQIEKIVSQCISEKNYSYDFSIEIGNSYFPKKDYGNISLPSGYYDGLKIKIGEAKGKNWWCVLFPPMCLIDSATCEFTSSSEDTLENSLSNETFSLVSSDSPNYQFKFKIVDFLNSL